MAQFLQQLDPACFSTMEKLEQFLFVSTGHKQEPLLRGLGHCPCLNISIFSDPADFTLGDNICSTYME